MNIRLVLIGIVLILIAVVVYNKYIKKGDVIYAESQEESLVKGMNHSRAMEAAILKNISRLENDNISGINHTINSLNSRFK